MTPPNPNPSNLNLSKSQKSEVSSDNSGKVEHLNIDSSSLSDKCGTN